MTIPRHSCIVRVRHPGRITPFLVSFMCDGLTGAKAYEIGEKRPRRGKHLLLTDSVRNWLEDLIPAPEPKVTP